MKGEAMHIKEVCSILVLLGGLVCYHGSHVAALDCASSQTLIESWYVYEAPGRNCSELIASTVENYHPQFVSDCKRWMGDEHPDFIWDYFIFTCQMLSDGTLKYMADVCCDGPSIQRCFICDNYTSGMWCREHASAVECGEGTRCITTVRYEGTYPNTEKIRTTGCSDTTTCSTLQAANSETCVDWSLDPTCTYCCGNNHCNYKAPSGPDLYVGDDPCLSEPCQNGATCLSKDPPEVSYNCTCAPGYTDPLCSTILDDFNPCEPNPCQNDGLCLASGFVYECHCRISWGGEHCELSYPRCSEGDTFCYNGGTCYDHGVYGRRCLCPAYFLGANCELEKVNCSIAMAYRVGAESGHPNTDCTARLLMEQNDLDSESGLYYCSTFMQQPGKPLFENHEDGEVNFLESRSFDSCSSGDDYTFTVKSFCCPTCYSMPCLNGGWCTQTANGDYSCSCRAGWYGRNCELRRNLCMVSGDPHYETFDGALYNFQGKCEYDLVISTCEACDSFKVVGVNEAVGVVSYLFAFRAFLCGHEVVIHRDLRVTLDDREVDPAAYIQMDCFTIMMSGGNVRIDTTYGLIVQYDGLHTGYVQLDTSLMGQVRGLCGDFDGNKENDYVSKEGEDYADDPQRDYKVASSWGVCADNSSAPEPVIDCTAISDLIDSYQYCGHLQDTAGIFQTCLSDETIDNEADVSNCRYDVCANSPNEAAMKDAACSALGAFVLKCEAKGHYQSWRNTTNCPLTCAEGFEYSFSASACPATCRVPDAPSICELPNKESCECPSGKLLDAGECIEPSECGCTDDYGNSFQVGESWLSETCDTQFTCQSCPLCDPPVPTIEQISWACATEDICAPAGTGLAVCQLYVDPCTVEVCENSGVCESSGLDWTCKCRSGWSGSNCHEARPLCPNIAFKCQNGGTCFDHGEFGPRCRCPLGFVGDNCEIPELVCTTSRGYRIGGTVPAVRYQFSCTAEVDRLQGLLDDPPNGNGLEHCKKRMVTSGEPVFEDGVDGHVSEAEARSLHECDKGDEYMFSLNSWCCPSCYAKPCQNGGYCTQTEDHDYQCACATGWTGKDCDVPDQVTPSAP